MSLFLGPIHQWMFNKILILESRAFSIAKALESAGVERDAVNKAVSEYGEKLAGQDLADMLGDNSIHQFLYGLIAKVQIFEASLVDLAKNSFDAVLAVAESHGKQTASDGLKASGAKSASLEDIYRLIHDNQLEGMPCDPGAQTTSLSPGKIGYYHSTCNHIQNWEYTDVDIKRMCALTNAWIKGFIAGVNGTASYEVKETLAGGAKSCKAEISIS
jgi:hypothetical protein